MNSIYFQQLQEYIRSWQKTESVLQKCIIKEIKLLTSDIFNNYSHIII